MQTLVTTARRAQGFDAKRHRVLDAAARVFSEEGYDRASMRRIAAEARLSLAGIYHYVASKEELLHWIQCHTFDSLLRDLEHCLEGVADPRLRLAAAVRNHIRHFGEHMHELKVCIREVESLEGEAHETVQDRRRTYFEEIHQLVRGVVPGNGSSVDSWLATANLFGMLNWIYQWYDAERSRVSLDELAARQTRLFLDGYLASASGDDGRGTG
jgi:AcrR family transcriptional regulator